MGKIDFAEINRVALAQLASLLEEWLPDGRWEGHEYKALNPVRHDSRIGSFSINVNNGVWADFACGDSGNDPVSLFAYLFHNGAQGEAAKDLANRLGVDAPPPSGERHAPARSAAAPAKPAREKDKPKWLPIHPAPDNAAAPPLAHYVRGRPERVWRYLDAQGKTIGFVYRFVTSDGGKETLPVCWAVNEQTGEEKWCWLSFAQPRPLYGLDRLARAPKATVLMVEGEKCADAGHAELEQLVSMTWPGGSKAVDKADFSTLAKRKVILWPDCDAQRERCSKAEVEQGVDPASKPLLPEHEQPGVVAMNKIAAKLHALKCEVWLVKIPKPGEKPSGWDIADAIDEGLRGDDLMLFIRSNLVRYESASAPATEGGEGASTPQMAGAGTDKVAREPWMRDLIWRSRGGGPEDCRENVFLILSRHPQWREAIGYNEFAYRIEKRTRTPAGDEPGEWNSQDDYDLGLWLAQKCDLLIKGEGTLAAGVSMVAHKNPFHPVREWLEKLPPWDGVERADHWLSDCLGVGEGTYSKLVGRFFLISMVARIYRPGCPAQYMPIFEGSQGRGKSTALRVLGGDWFAETPFKVGDKDGYMQLNGAWLYEIPEMDSFNRAETTAVKAFVTVQVDRYREPYARRPVDRPRQCVFAGNTNQGEYFKDTTGNRRFWPVRIGLIDLEKLAAWREQLFAEALHLYRKGERWHPTRDEELEYFNPEQEEREINDPWFFQLDAWLHAPEQRLNKDFTSTDILTQCFRVQLDKIDGNRSMATRVGNMMAKLGWAKARRTNGRREWIYLRPAEAIKGVEEAPALAGMEDGDVWPE